MSLVDIALVEQLFRTIRAECGAGAWSQGIELARSQAISGTDASNEEVRLRVKIAGRSVTTAVTLYPEDDEWMCDCDSKADACEHVAGAIIAFRRARKNNQAMPKPEAAGGSVRYRLQVVEKGLSIRRSVLLADKETPLDVSLVALAAGQARGPRVAPTQVDLQVDQLLNLNRLRTLPFDRLAVFWPQLCQANDILFEDKPVRLQRKALLPKVAVRKQDGAFELHFLKPPKAGTMVVPGIFRLRDEATPTLGIWGTPEVGGLDLSRLPHRERFGPSRVAELVGRVLPKLRQDHEVEVLCALPKLERSPSVRAVVDIELRGGMLSLLPQIEYGDPACARLVEEQLIHVGGPVPQRDRRGEARARERLGLLGLSLGRRCDFSGTDAHRQAQALRNFDGQLRGAELLERYPKTTLSPRFDDNHSLRFQSGAQGAGADDVVSAWERGQSFVNLDGGGMAPLPLGWLEQNGHRVRLLLDARDHQNQLAPHAKPTLARLCDDLGFKRPKLDGLEALLDKANGIPAARLPSDLQAELRPYQQQGVDWLCLLRDAKLGAILADDMGLGKTLQALCTIQGRTLVVCPRSVLHNWLDEIAKFRPALKAQRYHGPKRQLSGDHDVVLTTYALLRSDEAKLRAEHWDTVILDEAQAIKNPDSLAAQAAYRLPAAFRLALSGTPVENRLEELWSLSHFCNRGLLGGRQSFRENYEKPIAMGHPQAAQRLRDRIGPFMLRREKRTVAKDLPPRTHAVLRCELDTQERDVYQAIQAASLTDVVSDLEQGGGVMAALEALLRLRQAACDIRLVPGHGERALPSSKIQRLMLALDQAVGSNHKALVFSQWTGLLDRIEPELEKAGIAFTRLDGSTANRAGVVADFQDEEGPPVMLLSLKAGGTGLNLTAADHVFLLDPWWNPAAEDQAADRAHRIGQERPVMVYRMVAADTVEDGILKLQEKKRSIADAALGEGQRAATLSREDLLRLLR